MPKKPRTEEEREEAERQETANLVMRLLRGGKKLKRRKRGKK